MATSEALDVNLPTEGEATGSRERENIKDNTEATMSGAQNVKGLQESVITILPDNRKSENVVYIAKNESLDLCHGVDPEQIVDDVTNEVEVTTGEMESDDTQTVEIVGTVHQEAYICTDNSGMFNGNYVIDGEAILDIIEVQSTPEVKVAFSEQSTKNQHHGLSHMQTEIQPADSEGVVHVRKYEKEEVTFHIYNSSDNNTSTTEEPLKVEAEKSQGKGKFTCSECFHTFKRESTLKLHKKIHYNPYKCKTCGKCFSLASQLRKHAVIHSGTRPFKCHICSKAFHYSCSLMTHLRTHSLEKPFKCPHCDKSFVQSGNLTTHLMKHINKGEDDKLFKCEKCDKKFVSQEEWRAHFDSHSEDEPETKGFMCDLCGKYFKNRQYEAAHMLSHQKTFLKCPQCGKSLKNEKTLAVHMASVHCNEAKFMCEECGKLYTTKQSLRQHMKVHAVTLEYSMAKAKWREILESKKQQQQEDKKAKPAEPKKLHTCEECSKTFTEKRHLKDHMLIHAGRKDHVCTECGHSFRQKSTLTRHMKVHTGEKKYECGECGKTFREMANVKDHQLAVHLKIRPHTCQVCGKSFSLPLTLKKHLLTHSDDKEWFCFQCGKAFKCEQHLKNHKLVHNENRETYQCEYCLGLFKRPVCLKKHRQRCAGILIDSE